MFYITQFTDSFCFQYLVTLSKSQIRSSEQQLFRTSDFSFWP